MADSSRLMAVFSFDDWLGIRDFVITNLKHPEGQKVIILLKKEDVY